MNRNQLTGRAVFMSAMGLCLFFVQIPFALMILNSPGALEFAVWDEVTISIIVGLVFIAAPFIVFLILHIANKVSSPLFYFLIVGGTSFLVARQLDYFFMRPIDASHLFRGIAILIVVVSLFILLWKARRPFIIGLSAAAMAYPVFLIYFVVSAYPDHDGNSTSKATSTYVDVNPIFLLTFEKLVPSLLITKDGAINSNYPNIKKLAQISDVYTNTHSTSTRTGYALETLFTGKFAPEDDPSEPRKTLIEDFEADRTIFVLNDYTGRKYCDPLRHVCITSLGQAAPDRRLFLVRAWFITYLKTVVPDVILRTVFDMNEIDFFSDLYKKEEHFDTYPLRQFSDFMAVVKSQKSKRSLFALHSFLTDGPARKSDLTGDPNDRAFLPEKIRRIGLLDQKIGELLNFLEEHDLLKKSLILLSADTGSGISIWKKMKKSDKKNIIATPEATRIFNLIHWPNQQTGTVVGRTMLQSEIRDKILTKLDIIAPQTKPETVVRIHTTSEKGDRVFELSNDEKQLTKVQGF